ncbi:hypothetical protein ABW21_db0200722 [Orbilia brochopaga]|nr:hypothetical protein ABW21_db0200722 [Drechslerella brochopaga]
MADRNVAALDALPAELLLAILARLPSKPIIRDLSLTSRRLRSICMPYLFDSISIKSVAALSSFVDTGVAETVGRHVKRLVLRWDSVGTVVAIEEQDLTRYEDIPAAVTAAVGRMPGLRILTADLPGAFTALEKILEQNQHVALQTVAARNGRWELAGPIDGIIQQLAGIPGLKTLILDGVISRADTATTLKHIQLPAGAFNALDKLELTSLSTLNDTLLTSIVASASNLRTLSVRTCASITLTNTRRLLATHGRKLQHLTLEILKPRMHAEYNPTDAQADAAGEGSRHELDDISDAEHLCPAIRGCVNLRTLDLFTNKICSEIFRSSATSSSDGSLPTPPGSPALLPTHILELPTPPSDANPSSPRDVSTVVTLPPPLCSYPIPSYEKTRDETLSQVLVPPMPAREKMARVTLRIPYDASCFGKGAGGPSLQQRFTRLCDGMPAEELLQIGRRAFEDGRVGVVSVRGHWKGGPFLIMD